MAGSDMNPKNGIPVSGHTNWLCKPSETQIAGILITKETGDNHSILNDVVTGITTENCQDETVFLEQVDETSPCIIKLHCTPNSGNVIVSLLIISEARTIEVYSGSGDYCGTCRGERDHGWHADSTVEEKLFYRCHLVLESPATSCEVKLLSLGGRTCVGVARIVVGLRLLKATQRSHPAGPGIDLQRVQTMMEEMGTTLSPGARSLMDMVQVQQSKADVLGGFLPLLMGGGALAGLAKGAKVPTATEPKHPSSVNSTPCEEAGSDGAKSPTLQCPQSAPQALPFTMNHSKVSDMLSALLNGQPSQQSNPDLLPMLQSVCGQVTQLRLDASTSPESQRNGPNGSREEHVCCEVLEKALERRLEEMEQRLKEHMDQRLNALQQKLELALQMVLTQTPNPT
ncbi:ATPase PAAT [Chanos chanos]|uniref:ATPase PAAT n=1 Tax=Chanos chanos TaxID=29144 RepID=A0A6J2VJ65_CHACN|nr:uncharacterized protein C10orf88 homolog [Chanos chanos]